MSFNRLSDVVTSDAKLGLSRFSAISPIPWPADIKPKWIDFDQNSNDPVPQADAIIVTFTVAEKNALANTLTPGHVYYDWCQYKYDWESYEKHFTFRSPAKEQGCLGNYALIEINGKTVLLFGSNLHPATDDLTMPLRSLWKQLIEQTGAKLAIDTGTAGGIGADIVEGDVLITSDVTLDYGKLFAKASFAHNSYNESPGYSPSSNIKIAQNELFAANSSRLSSIANRPPIIIDNGVCVSVDYFAFGTPDDSYGLLKAAPNARMVEMDAGALCLACEDLGDKSPYWLSVRCASDPQVKEGTIKAQKKEADYIYEHYGYWAAIGSVITSAVAVADFQL